MKQLHIKCTAENSSIDSKASESEEGCDSYVVIFGRRVKRSNREAIENWNKQK